MSFVTTPSTNQPFWPDSGQILRHQYGISVAESQTLFLAKPQVTQAHYWCYVWVSYNLRKYGEHMFRENSLLHLSYKLYVLCVQTKDNNNSPHGKFHRFLFPFSSKFPDLNFAPYVLYIYSCYMKPVRDTNSEPSLPVAKRPQRRIASWTAVFVAGWNRGKLPTVSCFVTQSTFRQND